MAAIDATEQAKGIGRAWLAPLLLLAACGSPPSPLDASVIDTIDVVHDAGPPHEYTYVIDQITIDPTDDPSVPHTGFNLDGLFSSATDPNGCLHQDFFSATDDDLNCPSAMVMGGGCLIPGCTAGGAQACTGGVDNRFLTLVNTFAMAGATDFRATYSTLLQNNQLALLVRVSNIIDDANSPNVTVRLYFGYPTFTSGCTGGVLPNREYTVARGSIATGGTTIDDATATLSGRIVNGRLEAFATDSAAFVLVLPVSVSQWYRLPLWRIQMRANLGPSTLSTGALGGWVAATDFINDFPEHETAIAAEVLGPEVDIAIDGICDDEMDTPHRYGGISLAIGLHAVPATISSTVPIADAAAPGTCDGPAVDAGTPRDP